MQFTSSNTMMIRSLSLIVLALAAGGCAGADKGGNLSERFSWLNREPKPQQPNSIVLVWTDTVLNTAGQAPVRGFGGRVMFFDQPGGDQIPVSGKLVIYAYDESDGGAVTIVPDREFVFTSVQLKELYGKTDLGPSYSVWIPWDKVGGQRKQISLLARFESDSGAVTISEMSRHLLPGIAPELTAEQQKRPPRGGEQQPSAVQASYDQSGQGAAEPAISQSVVTRSERHTRRRRMTVDTIDLAHPLQQLMPRGVAAGAVPPTGGESLLGMRAAVATEQPGVRPIENNQPPGLAQPFALAQQPGSAQWSSLPSASPPTLPPWQSGGNLAEGQPTSAYAGQTNPPPSVWEWAQLRAQLASQEAEQRQRPQAHSARPRPSAQAAQFARQATGRDWSQPSLPTQPSAPPGGFAPTHPFPGR